MKLEGVNNMPRFFSEVTDEHNIIIVGDDAKHITKSLRMKVGQGLTVCHNKIDYFCTIKCFIDNTVHLNLDSKLPSISEPNVNTHLYIAFSKGDKMDLVIQKATEIGVTEITPIYTKFITSCPDENASNKKVLRYQKIAMESAKQSGRGIIPTVHKAMNFDECLSATKDSDITFIMYEKNGNKFKGFLQDSSKNISLIIGSEGGFSEMEVQKSIQYGVIPINLGSRILRCETAPIVALSIIMELTNNF